MIENNVAEEMMDKGKCMLGIGSIESEVVNELRISKTSVRKYQQDEILETRVKA